MKISQRSGKKLIHRLHNVTEEGMETPRPWSPVGSWGPAYLFVVGVSPHDGRVHDATEQHGQRMHRQGPVPGMLLNTVADLLIGEFHGFDGILQRADFLL